MHIKGKIHFQKKVYVRRKECYGKCATWGNEFLIAISLVTFRNFDVFAETVLHELLHLGLTTVSLMSKSDISDAHQHKIIGSVMRTLMRGIKKYRVKE